MEARFSAPVQTVPGAQTASCTMGTGSFPGVKSSHGVTPTAHPLLVPWSRKSRAIPLLPLWAVRPLQSLSACARVHFTFTYIGYRSQTRHSRLSSVTRTAKVICKLLSHQHTHQRMHTMHSKSHITHTHEHFISYAWTICDFIQNACISSFVWMFNGHSEQY